MLKVQRVLIPFCVFELKERKGYIMKKTIIIFLALVVVLSLLIPSISCKKEEAQMHVVMVGGRAVGDPFDNEFHDTLIAKMEELGVKYTVLTAPGNEVPKILSFMEEAISLKPDLVIVQPFDREAFVEPIKKISDAGIPVVCTTEITVEAGWPYIKSYIGADFTSQGQVSGELMIKGLKEKHGEDLTGLKAVEITGLPGQGAAIERSAGWQEVVKAAGIEILESQTSNWDKAQALAIMETYLTKYDKIDACYGCNDFSTLGAIEAAEAAGRADEILFTSVDGVKEGLTAIKEGRLYGSCLQSAAAFATLTADIALKVLKGEEVEFINLIDNPAITKENVDEFLK